jgi:enamine deaminase RidA (YjgF/YER057c/UK114 family)
MAPTSFKLPPTAPAADDDDLPKALVPPAWRRPVGYANGMIAKGRVIVTAGLVGWDVMGNFPEGFVPQARQLFTNMLAVLAEGGAGPEHLVRLTWYVVDLDEYRSCQRELGRAYREIIGAHFPAMAVVQVAGLVERAARIEIEATAVVPE